MEWSSIQNTRGCLAFFLRLAWDLCVEIDHFALVEALCCFTDRIENSEIYLEFYGHAIYKCIVFHPIMEMWQTGSPLVHNRCSGVRVQPSHLRSINVAVPQKQLFDAVHFQGFGNRLQQTETANPKIEVCVVSTKSKKPSSHFYNVGFDPICKISGAIAAPCVSYNIRFSTQSCAQDIKFNPFNKISQMPQHPPEKYSYPPT